MKRIACVLALMLFGSAQQPSLVAAATTGEPAVSASDYAAYRGSGRGAIYGHLDVNSESAFGPSIAVYLMPGTSYTHWWVNYKISEAQAYAWGKEMDPLGVPLNPDVAKVVRKTYSDSNGQFAFIGLPSGWYVLFAVSEDRPPAKTLRQGYSQSFVEYTWNDFSEEYTPHVVDRYTPAVIDAGEDFMLMLGSDEFRVISGAPAREVPTKVFVTINCGQAHKDICPGTTESSSPY